MKIDELNSGVELIDLGKASVETAGNLFGSIIDEFTTSRFHFPEGITNE